MAAIVVLPQGTYPAGSRVLGPAAVPTGITGFTLALDRAAWVAGVTLAMTVDLSLDSGVTWNTPPETVAPYPVGLTAEGGVALDKNGAAYTQTTLSTAIPQSASTTRQLRATVVITGGSLTTKGTLTTV
jgi:hypothetical protein